MTNQDMSEVIAAVIKSELKQALQAPQALVYAIIS